jgi:hypothetical protein
MPFIFIVVGIGIVDSDGNLKYVLISVILKKGLEWQKDMWEQKGQVVMISEMDILI